MYTYEYERIDVDTGGFFAMKITAHEEVIARRAGNGWRYVGYIPAIQNSHGLILEMDLIFEKEL